MPYEFLEDVATADVAFRAWADSLEGLFIAAGDATMNVMVADLATIAPTVEQGIEAEGEAEDLLLVNFLQELVYYKDAKRLLLRPVRVAIRRDDGRLALSGSARGEPIDPAKHELKVDVKAVTYHRLKVERTDRGWEAFVILDI